MIIRSVLVVCAANICRSPAAASLLDERLRDRGVDVTVTSAGVTALGDKPACDLALSLVGRGDSAGHRSRRLHPEQLEAADLVVGMEAWHLERVRAMSSTAVTRLLDEDGIPDPHAIGYQAHAMVFGSLREGVRRLADELAQPRSSA